MVLKDYNTPMIHSPQKTSLLIFCIFNFVEQYPAISLDSLRKHYSENFFLEFWWWVDYDIFCSWYLSLPQTLF